MDTEEEKKDAEQAAVALRKGEGARGKASV